MLNFRESQLAFERPKKKRREDYDFSWFLATSKKARFGWRATLGTAIKVHLGLIHSNSNFCSNVYWGLSGLVAFVHNLVGTPSTSHLDPNQILGDLYHVDIKPFPNPSWPIWCLYDFDRKFSHSVFWPIWACGLCPQSCWNPFGKPSGPT